MCPARQRANSARMVPRPRPALRPVRGAGSADSPSAGPHARAASDRTAQLAWGVAGHIAASMRTLEVLERHSLMLARWGGELAERLSDGRRLLVAGNGGSAAEAQHLTAELVGRYDGDRPAFSAIALHGDTSSMTAIGNDYGYDEVFARQIRAHGRAGDVVILLSTSGQSPNLLSAAAAARTIGATTWALTGPGPNPLSSAVDEALLLEGRNCHVQESQLVAIHALCECFDACIAERMVGAADDAAAAAASDGREGPTGPASSAREAQ